MSCPANPEGNQPGSWNVGTPGWREGVWGGTDFSNSRLDASKMSYSLQPGAEVWPKTMVLLWGHHSSQTPKLCLSTADSFLLPWLRTLQFLTQTRGRASSVSLSSVSANTTLGRWRPEREEMSPDSSIADPHLQRAPRQWEATAVV